jgi:tRNA threonylcarbamoyladenosine biosynthesis protein TsaE
VLVEQDMMHIQLNDLGDTEKLGEILGNLAKAGDVICLDGDLGAGKTTLSQAIARGLEVPDNCYVTSPSFAILHEYEGRIPMYHMDFYRLQDAGEVEDLGFEEYFYLEGLTVIEWSNRAVEILPDERMILEISINENLTRTVTLKCTRKYNKILRQIGKKFKN